MCARDAYGAIRSVPDVTIGSLPRHDPASGSLDEDDPYQRLPFVFGSESRIRHPVLLTLVFGVFLVIVGITATSQAIVVSSELSGATLEAVVGSDAAAVRNLANSTMLESDVAPNGVSAARAAELGPPSRPLIRRGQILRAEIRRPDGSVIVGGSCRAGRCSERPRCRLRAGPFEPADDRDVGPRGRRCRRERPRDRIAPPGGPPVVGRWQASSPWSPSGGTPRRCSPRVEGVQRDVVIVTLSAALVTCVLLYLIFRAAQQRLTRQTAALLDATRRDSLTGMLNHGALVFDVAVAIEAARAGGGPLALALIDIDNFRLLNENHGYPTGDEALHRVAAALQASVPPEAIVGRYGPDEFLVPDHGRRRHRRAGTGDPRPA